MRKRKSSSSRSLFNKHRRNTGTLMPPFANCWYLVCRSADVKTGDVNPKSVFGREIVIFRGENGQVGVLDAFCPHLGTHLGYGGVVKDNCIVCPYHSWKFETDGKCIDVPYCDSNIEKYSQIDARKYHVRETMGMVYVWYHVDWLEPTYELDCFEGLEDCHVVKEESPDTWDMHLMEMSQNSADYYHFRTTHHSLPYSNGLIKIDHDTSCEYRANDQSHVAVLTQNVSSYSMFGFPAPEFVVELSQPKTTVTFFGPSILLFKIEYSSYTVTTVMNLTPIEDLKQELMTKTFVSNVWFQPFGLFFHYMTLGTVNQDRQVWEHKSHCKPMRLVRGDGQFVMYSNWLKQFYSENSIKVDLSW